MLSVGWSNFWQIVGPRPVLLLYSYNDNPSVYELISAF